MLIQRLSVSPTTSVGRGAGSLPPGSVQMVLSITSNTSSVIGGSMWTVLWLVACSSFIISMSLFSSTGWGLLQFQWWGQASCWDSKFSQRWKFPQAWIWVGPMIQLSIWKSIGDIWKWIKWHCLLAFYLSNCSLLAQLVQYAQEWFHLWQFYGLI